jgi:hypothetical protein
MILKGKAKREREEHNKGQVGSGLGVLAGYGDSEDESEDDVIPNAGDVCRDQEAEDSQGEKTEGADQKKPPDDDAVKMARRARAKEWAEKRRAS